MSRMFQYLQAQGKLEEPEDILSETEEILSTPTPEPMSWSEARAAGLLDSAITQDRTFDNSVKSYEAIKRNPAVFEAAKRFLADRHNMTNVKDEDVVDEFIEHFRSFDVNEMTTAGDYGYVSAAAADATKKDDEKAKMRLADYRLLYQTFREMPHFYEEGGAENAFGDYVEGLLKAPSTYLGLL